MENYSLSEKTRPSPEDPHADDNEGFTSTGERAVNLIGQSSVDTSEGWNVIDLNAVCNEHKVSRYLRLIPHDLELCREVGH